MLGLLMGSICEAAMSVEASTSDGSCIGEVIRGTWKAFR